MDYRFEAALRERYEARAARGKKTEALFETLRAAIMTGEVAYGAKLPATRSMAASYGLSRGSVNTVYEMLVAEGYVETAVGRGTYAAFRPAALAGAAGAGAEAAGGERAKLPLSAWARRLPPVPAPRAQGDMAGRLDAIDLSSMGTDPQLFPTADWKRAVYAEVRGLADRQSEDAYAAHGHRPLREAIALHLARERGIAADPERIMITNGSAQAIALLGMLLIGEGDRVVVENPSYAGMYRAVRAAGGVPVPAAVDRSGIVPQRWDARLLFVTPARQFPTGVVLPLARRTALLEWASAAGAVIVEDDYDSEFRWGGRPVEPLKTLDREDRVVYLGTFSKTMLTDLRIGYAVVPEALAEPFRRAKFLLEPHPSAIAEQRALARFMADGGYGRHLRRMQRICGRRLALFRDGLRKAAADRFELYPADAGLHLFARWLGDRDGYDALKREALREGVVWSDAMRFWAAGEPPVSALFGFAHADEETLAEAVRRIGRALARVSKREEDDSRA